MNCRKAQKHIPFYLAPHESWLKPRDRTALEAHLAICGTCRQEFEETRRAIEFFRKYRQIAEDTQPLKGEPNLNEPEQKTLKVFGYTRIVVKVASVAAVIVICLGMGLVFLTNRDAQKQELAQPSSTQVQAIVPEITITENGVAVSASRLQTTDATNIREFLINNKHRLVMNRDTTLSVGVLAKNERLGCLIKLRSGEILAHVVHDGNPFEVRSRHGNAVITGTTFDMKVADHETALVVVEGSVRFESDKGTVHVLPGRFSQIRGISAPLEPKYCNVQIATAWARLPTGKTPIVDYDVRHSAYLEKLEVPLALPVNHEADNYTRWVEENAEWFRREFPQIFQAMDVLRTDGVEVDYPTLLKQSGLLSKFEWPPASKYRVISHCTQEGSLKLASIYGYHDAQWLNDNRLKATPLNSKCLSSIKALEQWQNQINGYQMSKRGIPATVLLSSFHASVYLSNMRTLALLV